MVQITALWLPVLVSAVIVFIASSIIHTVLPWHKGDYPKLANEDDVRKALRPLAIPPGDYMVPRPSSQEDLRSPEFVQKMNEGPVIMMTVMPNGPWSMKRNLVQWFVFCLVVGILAAYVAGAALPPGTPYLHVFQLAGVTAFIGYAVALWPMSIWYRRAWSLTVKATIDGLIYALLTAGVFGWLWPR